MVTPGIYDRGMTSKGKAIRGTRTLIWKFTVQYSIASTIGMPLVLNVIGRVIIIHQGNNNNNNNRLHFNMYPYRPGTLEIPCSNKLTQYAVLINPQIRCSSQFPKHPVSCSNKPSSTLFESITPACCSIPLTSTLFYSTPQHAVLFHSPSTLF